MACRYSLPCGDSKNSPLASGSDEVMSERAPPRSRRPRPGGCRRRERCARPSSASGACSEPACTCDSPRDERMKTSQSGQVSRPPESPGARHRRIRFGRLRARRACARRRRAPPRAPRRRLRGPGGGARRRGRVRRAAACEHLVELVPVELAEVVVPALLVPVRSGSGSVTPEDLGLRHQHVDETLTQLVVAEALDLPRHRLRRVRATRRRAARTSSAPARTSGSTDSCAIALLRRRAAHEREQDLEALPLVERLLLADAHHGAP